MSIIQTIVVSAVNIRKGGTLTILQDCLCALSASAVKGEYRVIAIVHCKTLCNFPGIEYIEIPWSVRSWIYRLWCEYITMHRISRQIGDIDLWLSLHDTTPHVKAKCQAVYCHNAFSFFHWRWRHFWQNYRIVCFALFSRWIYRINLYRNRFIIVQEEWFRISFSKMFHLSKERIIVFPPSIRHEKLIQQTKQSSLNNQYTFLYPAFPDVHKNFECLCEAARLLENEVGKDCFQVMLTTSRELNRYSHWLHHRWGNVSSIRFCGFQNRQQLDELYTKTDCLVFPSHIETWGLPISEFAHTGRPMLLADLPYAHESACGSSYTAFFDPDSPQELKTLMRSLLQNNISFLRSIPDQPHQSPHVSEWPELIRKLLT